MDNSNNNKTSQRINDKEIPIETEILYLTGQKLRLDSTLASLYRVETKALKDRYDKQFKIVFQAIRQLMTERELVKRPIGYIREESP